MRLVLWANGARGAACLDALLRAGRRPELLLVHDGPPSAAVRRLLSTADRIGIDTLAPPDPNAPDVEDAVRAAAPDVMVLAGYGRILGPAVLAAASGLTVNLHAGRLPQYRGSSPMNWALIRGERSFSLSIIEVDAGVDTGDVLLERSYPIGSDDTIVDLHAIAEREFPMMLLEALGHVERGTLSRRRQDPDEAHYFPLRFPDDGLVLFDALTAREIHNRIRALRPPYPGAFSYYDGRRVTLVRSELTDRVTIGEPGRAYRVGQGGALVCASDRCLWIREAVFADDESPALPQVFRYGRFATLREAAARWFEHASRERSAPIAAAHAAPERTRQQIPAETGRAS